MSRKRLEKLIMSRGIGPYDARMLIATYKRNGYRTNYQVLNAILEDLEYWGVYTTA